MSIEKFKRASDGVRIYYEVHGTGDPLLFLHGNSQNGRVFKRQIDYFSKFYQCIVMDLRAHGFSSLVHENLTFQRIAQDIAEVLNFEKIEKVTIIGFSDGANVAMFFATSFPDRVNKLVLNAGNIKYEGLNLLSRVGLKTLYFTSACLRKNLSVIELMIEDSRLALNDLLKITAPTLVLNGQFDVIKHAHAKEIASHIKQAELVIVPFATHMFFYFQPMRFNYMIEQFLHKEKNDE